MKALLIIASFLMIGCSSMHIVKDCTKVEKDNLFVCKNLKPWE